MGAVLFQDQSRFFWLAGMDAGLPFLGQNICAKERKRNNFPVWVFRRLSGKALERRNTGRLSSSSNAAGQDAWAVKSGSYFVHVPKQLASRPYGPRLKDPLFATLNHSLQSPADD